MAERKPFLLRLDPRVYESLHRWAAEEFRSVNGQIEFLLRRILEQEGRLPGRDRSRGARPEGRGGSGS
ncbi:MAG TPA: hypothetical protein VKF62_05545 [Planctomycetota bacterium]|nr:hypothetical protein [Planctomycetota bacterium]